MKRHVSIVFVVVCGLASCLSAQDSGQAANVAGKWQMSWQGRDGAKQGTLQLQQDGSKLTGTFVSDRGSAAITGTVDGNNISFSTQGQGHHNFTMVYTGSVEGEKISGTFQPQGGQGGMGGGGHHGGGQQNRSWTATRQADNPSPTSSSPPSSSDGESDDQPGF